MVQGKGIGGGELCVTLLWLWFLLFLSCRCSKKDDKINLDISKISKNKFFYDIIYKPNETNFLKVGKTLGNRTENGKMMFIYQASAAFKVWHGFQPKINKQLIGLLDQ